MDTVMQLTAYGDAAPEGLAAAGAAIERLERLVSVTREDSEVYRANSRPGQALPVSEDTALLIENALRIGARTGGALDISVYPIVKAWGFTTDGYRIPSDGELAALLASVDYTAIEYERDAQTLRVPEGMQIDLGSIAKGYSGDLAAEALRASGVRSALLSLGGNIQTLGAKPNGEPWRVAVRDPEDAELYAGAIDVTDKAVVTSGGYERYFTGENGEIYWHIMDPATGRPARSGLISVTVVGTSGMECDALSTALFVLGAEGAAAYWREYGGFDAVLITENREIWITEGIERAFSPLGAYEDADLTVVRK
jgi:thiamine biosynthesis lipoprotein